jgi:hypothetical protein
MPQSGLGSGVQKDSGLPFLSLCFFFFGFLEALRTAKAYFFKTEDQQAQGLVTLA